jgi:hypothetical protein
LGGQFAATERVIVISIKLVRMNRTVAIALAIVALANAAPAQQTLKILTPSDDSYAVFMIAMDSDDPRKVLAVGGWALGFLSGVVQETGVDFLKGATSENESALCRLQEGACPADVVRSRRNGQITRSRPSRVAVNG